MGLFSCITDYDLREVQSEKILVVNGRITDKIGENQMILNWSGTFEEPFVSDVKNANVYLKSTEDEMIQYKYIDEGKYVPEDPFFYGEESKGYQLIIQINDRTYQSTMEFFTPSSEIDTLKYEAHTSFDPVANKKKETLRFNISTKAKPSSSRFNKYEAEFTWLIIAPFPRKEYSRFKFETNLAGDTIGVINIPTVRDTAYTYCWNSTITAARLVSTEGLSSDALNDVPIASVAADGRLIHKVSMLIKQYSLNRDAYQFFSVQQKFNQFDNSLYGIQPGFVPGNISNREDIDEKVVGYFYCAGYEEKRRLIKFSELPKETARAANEDHMSCDVRNVAIEDYSGINNAQNLGLVVVFVERGMIQFASLYCTDCIYFGSHVKPEWWGSIY